MPSICHTYPFKWNGSRSLSWIAASNVQQVHLETHALAVLHGVLGVLNGLAEGAHITAAAADVEADTDDIEIQFLGFLE